MPENDHSSFSNHLLHWSKIFVNNVSASIMILFSFCNKCRGNPLPAFHEMEALHFFHLKSASQVCIVVHTIQWSTTNDQQSIENIFTQYDLFFFILLLISYRYAVFVIYRSCAWMTFPSCWASMEGCFPHEKNGILQVVPFCLVGAFEHNRCVRLLGRHFLLAVPNCFNFWSHIIFTLCFRF